MAWLDDPQKRGGYGNIVIKWVENGKTKKKSTGTKDPEEAQKILDEWHRIQNEMLEQAKNAETTFWEVAKEYVHDPHANGKRRTKRKKAPGTVERYLNYFKSFLRFAGDDLSIIDVTPNMVDQYIEWADKQGNLKISTVQATVQRIGSVMRYAHKKGYVVKDISEDIADINYTDSEVSELQPRVVRAFTKDELSQIIPSARERSEELEMYYVGLLTLGCRVSELGAITWDCVNRETGKVRIMDAKRKGKVVRNVPISNNLKPYLDRAYENKHELPHNHIFTIQGGQIATGDEQRKKAVNSYIYTQLKKICAREGINHGVRVHSFRYTFIQNYLQNNVNIKTIMNWVGHTRLETFEIYLNLFLDQSEDINVVSYSFDVK